MATFTFLDTFNGTFAGTAGDDVFILPATNGSIDSGDTFFGGAGNDTLRLDTVVALFFFGTFAPQWMAGVERIIVNYTGAGSAVIIGATAGAPEGGTITMIGGVGNDVFNIAARSAGYNGVFESGGGNDSFSGGGGDDLFRPGTGGDSFVAGGGNDTVEFSQSSLPGPQPFDGTDSLIGGSGTDTLRITGDAAPGVVLTVNLQAPLIESFEVIDLTGYSGPSSVGMFSSYTADGNVTVRGGSGADTVFGGTISANRLVTLFEGGGGNDRYETYTGSNIFRPGAGADRLVGGGDVDVLEMALADLDPLDSFATNPFYTGVMRFTSGGVLTQTLADRLTGFERLELGPAGVSITLQALPALSGQDAALSDYDYVSVRGGTGRDRINANPFGTAPVVIFGGADNDTIIGTNNAVGDTLHGDDGNDLIFGGAGPDSISGGQDNDTIDGGAGDDLRLSGGAGNDRILLGAGNDDFVFNSQETGQDSLFGGEGDDRVTVGAISNPALSPDLISGGAGFDRLLFPDLSGGVVTAAMADLYSGFEEITLTFFGSMTFFVTDSLAESAETPLSIISMPLLTAQLVVDASAVTDTGIRISRADYTTAGASVTADTLIGGGGADTISRVGGADLVMAGGGDDLVITPFPVAAIDPARLDGGAGIDTLRALGATNSAGFSFATLTGFEIIELAGDGPNAISFVAGGLPAGGSVEIRGGSDADFLDASALTTGARFLGRAGDDMLTGGSAADLLDAGTGADLVFGDDGNDTVRFADLAGDDIADGGAGLDRLELAVGNARIPAALLANFTGFEALALDLAGGRVVLPVDFTTAVGGGVFTVDLRTAAGAAASSLLASAVANKLDITGGDGAEIIRGGRGADTISDGAGADQIQGHLGADRIELVADGAVDRVAYGNANDGTRDIFAAANAGTLAQADTITGFAGAGDTGNLLELVRSGFGGLGAKSAVVTLAAGGAIDLSSAAVFLLHAADAVAGGFANRAGINAAFANRVQAGDLGQGGFVVARGAASADAALYYVRDLDGLAGIADADIVQLLAVLLAPGAITASEISLL